MKVMVVIDNDNAIDIEKELSDLSTCSDCTITELLDQVRFGIEAELNRTDVEEGTMKSIHNILKELHTIIASCGGDGRSYRALLNRYISELEEKGL